MPPKKNKGVKLSLAEFNVDSTTGTNWADEEMDLPVVPGFASAQSGFAAGGGMSSGGGGDRWGAGPGGPPRRDYGGSGVGGGGRGDDAFGAGPDRGYGASRLNDGAGAYGGDARGGYAMRDPIPLPDRAPFTAHIGNLTFDVTEGEIGDFFGQAGARVKGVRLVRDRETDRPRGFGYVEFEDRGSLEQALGLSGSNLAGRDVRVTVAEAPKGGMAGERDLDWGSARKTQGPLPAVERTSSYGGRGGAGGYEAREPREMREPREPERDLDWGAARSRALPAPVERQERFGAGGGGRERRPFEAREGAAAGGERGERRPFEEGVRRDSGPDLDWSSTRRGPLASEGGAAAAPAERRKLSLAPRTASVGDVTPASATSPVASSKASPFGAARAVDTSAAERKAEEKRQAAQKEREAKQEAAAAAKKDRKQVDIMRRTESMSLEDDKKKEENNVDKKAEAELAAIVKKEETPAAVPEEAADGWTVSKKK